MASSKSTEEAIRTDVDETTINAIVRSFNTDLVTTFDTNDVQRHQQLFDKNLLNINQNSSNKSAINVTNIDSNPTLSTSTIQINNNNNNNNNNNKNNDSALISDPIQNIDTSHDNNDEHKDSYSISNINDNNDSNIELTDFESKIPKLNINNNSSVESSLVNIRNLVTTTTNPIIATASATIPTTPNFSAVHKPIINNNNNNYTNENGGNLTAQIKNESLPVTGHHQHIRHHYLPQTNTASVGQSGAFAHQQYQSSTTVGFVNKSNLNMSKNNEPVKIVYPSTVGTSQPAVLNMNNRVTFTSQSMPNGTINLATISTQQSQQIMQTTTPISTNTNTMSAQQPQTIVIKNQGTNQNMVGNSLIPSNSIQLLNMRPPTPTAQVQSKSVATVSPRVVLSNPQMVASRPTNSAITLSALPTGQSGLLLKTENGQFRLLTVGTAPTQQAQSTLPNSSANQTIRIQTVPSVSRFAGPQLALRKTFVTQQPLKTKVQSAVSSSSNVVGVNSSHVTTLINTTSGMMPPIASVAPVNHSMAPQTLQPQIIVSSTQQPNATPNTMPANQANLQNTKEKCRKFLANLLELSSREPKAVASNVCTLIQELIDANVEPDEFCDRLERLLNASPQPCLIGFLKKSLPLLRQSLFTKELTIEGIKPPPHNIAFPQTFGGNIQAQVRPIVPTLTSIGGQTQVRMIAPPRPTTITRQSAPVRIQGPINTVPRLTNASVSQIRTPSGATIIQQHPNVQLHTNPPALHPVNSFTAPGGAQIRASGGTIGRSVTVRHTAPTTIKQTTVGKFPTGATISAQAPIKVGSTHIKPIINSNSASAPSTIVVASNSSNINSTNTSSTVPNIIATQTIATANSSSGSKTISNKAQSTIPSTPAKLNAANKEKERKASSTFYQQSSMSASMYGDDDINDVAAMGGVNLAEETQRILGSTELIGRQIRSCKDEVFLHMPALQAKIRNIIAKHGLEEPNNEVAVLVSHACQERLKNIVEKLAVIAEHRIDIIKVDPRYEVTKDVRAQIKFLEELDKVEQKRHEEQEREMLMRAAKSRSKTEDPEQAKLKAKAKEMQRAEMEELRQRDANLTALQAIGPRKKPKLESDATASGTGASGGLASGASSITPLRPRIKRVNLRDMIFYLEQERDSCRSSMLYKAYLK